MVGSIGSLYGKTIRLTYQLYHDTQGTHLKGFVDLLDGQGPRQFVDLLNPQASGLPLVDHAAISGYERGFLLCAANSHRGPLRKISVPGHKIFTNLYLIVYFIQKLRF
ncbi:MAG: hypothetical protein WBF33_09435 [Candidatus Nitrosopolaris sp.]|jgi:hypothetical protein